MKNKTPKPRVMWANYYSNSVHVHTTEADAVAWDYACGTHYPAPLHRVAVIPLDNVEAIAERAWRAYVDSSSPTYGGAIRAALTAAGIPCKRKASK